MDVLETDAVAERRPKARAGRKLDHTRDAAILDTALAVLAESGYDGMTIDMVAARAGAARATVYRRWATKADLVLDAVARMSATDIDLDQLPDTGSLREDMIATILPQTIEEQEFRIQVLTALLALSKTDHRLAEAATGAGIGPWIEANRVLMQRAVDRGEFPPADTTTLAQVIPMMCLCRAVQQEPITREFSLTLIDGVIIPALRGGG
jgi:AcrR family transcriptional regulator